MSRRSLSILSRHLVPPHLNEHPVPIVVTSLLQNAQQLAEKFVARGFEASVVEIDNGHKSLLTDIDELHGQQPPVLITEGAGLSAALKYLESKPLCGIVAVRPIFEGTKLEFPVCDIVSVAVGEEQTPQELVDFYEGTPFQLIHNNDNNDICNMTVDGLRL